MNVSNPADCCFEGGLCGQAMADPSARDLGAAGGDDTLEEDMSVVDTSFISSDHTEQLIDNIERLRLDTGYTDLTISIDGQLFPCHKVGGG